MDTIFPKKNGKKKIGTGQKKVLVEVKMAYDRAFSCVAVMPDVWRPRKKEKDRQGIMEIPYLSSFQYDSAVNPVL